MKKKINVPFILSVMACTGLLFAACNESSVDPDAGRNGESITGENFTFYKSEPLAEEAAENRSDGFSDSFQIENVTIEETGGEKLMHIEVTQELGCQDGYTDKFEVIWDGIMLMIYPPQVGFFLTFDSSGCTELQENVSDTVTLNLYDIFGEKEFVDDIATFTVVNASSSSPDDDYVIHP